MNEDERYLFDLNGYLLLRGVLTPEEVAELNSGIDHHSEEMTAIDRSLAGESGALSGTSRRKDLGGMLAWERPLLRALSPPARAPGRQTLSRRHSRHGLPPRPRPRPHRHGRRLRRRHAARRRH